MIKIKPPQFERNYFGKCQSCGSEYIAYVGELDVCTRVTKGSESLEMYYRGVCDCGGFVEFVKKLDA